MYSEQQTFHVVYEDMDCVFTKENIPVTSTLVSQALYNGHTLEPDTSSAENGFIVNSI